MDMYETKNPCFLDMYETALLPVILGCSRAIAPIIMPRTKTNSRRCVDKQRGRRWDLKVMAKALFIKATNDEISIRVAASSAASSPESQLSPATLHRYWSAMRSDLKDINYTDEAKILN